MTRTLIRSTAIALAAAALTAPTALARPDAPAPVAKPAVSHTGRHSAGASRFATRPVLDRNPAQPSRPASPVTVSVTSADTGIDWATIAIGIAGSLLAVGAIALITARMRRPHARIPA
jgi:hypothetical protein